MVYIELENDIIPMLQRIDLNKPYPWCMGQTDERALAVGELS